MSEIKKIIQDFFIENLSFLPPELVVIIISAVPILELRGGMPAAALLGLSFPKALACSIIGNILPIAPILLFFRPLSKWLVRFKFYERFYNWLCERTMKKGDKVKKYGVFGLILFTAVPLPTTGAYTACLAAILFLIPFRAAFFAISIGVLIASIIVGIVTYPLFL